MSALKVRCWPAHTGPLSWHEPEVMLNPAHHPWSTQEHQPHSIFWIPSVLLLNGESFQSCHNLCFPATAPTGDSFNRCSESPSSAFLLVPLPSSHHPLQETRRPRNHGSFYYPVLLKVLLNHGVPAGGLPCSCVMLRAPCREGGSAVACLESAPVGVSLGNYWPGNGLPAPTCLISCLALSCLS